MATSEKTFQKKLLGWYLKNKRDLPWRKNKDPYRIWISEIMLQQTQVKTVLPYYERWLQAFPNLKTLALAPLNQVLKHWEGLGYYSRARNLHKTAQILVDDFGGRFPEEPEIWLELPGIGRYTAGAILSIAFDLPEAILDGNVIRVLTRYFGISENITTPPIQNWLWEKAKELLPQKNPGDFNQAMMELGALVCTPSSPSCLLCPLQTNCAANLSGRPESFPVKEKIKYEKLGIAIGLIWKSGKILIQKRPLNGRMGGLWEFPGGKIEKKETAEEALLREMQEELGVTIQIKNKRNEINHAYTRFRIRLHAFDCIIVEGKPKALAADAMKWVKPERLQDFAFPSANTKLIPDILQNPWKDSPAQKERKNT